MFYISTEDYYLIALYLIALPFTQAKAKLEQSLFDAADHTTKLR